MAVGQWRVSAPLGEGIPNFGMAADIMYDRDSDQNFEYWEYFRDQELIATGLDTDFDGVPDQRSKVNQ